MSAVFPQELFDTIIDRHFHDRHTLATCSLVCKAWLPASRYHLFHTIKLGDENWNTFLDLLQHQRSIAPNMNKFIPFASPECGRGDDESSSHLLQFPPSSAFHAVQVLELDGSQFTGSFSRFAHLISSFPSITLLHMDPSSLLPFPYPSNPTPSCFRNRLPSRAKASLPFPRDRHRGEL